MKKKYKIIFAAEALLDVKESRDWYNLQQKNLGDRFVEEVKSTINQIAVNPLVFSVKYDKIRTANCKIFPYSIHFELDELQPLIRIIAVFHFSRRPLWFKD